MQPRSILSPNIICCHAMSLDRSENEVQIDYLHKKRFHMVKRWQKSVQYIVRYSTKYASFLPCRLSEVHK